MPRGFGRLPFLGRRSAHADRSDGNAPAVRAPIDPDAAPIGPPILMPAAIIRQVLFDSTELIPVWARPRPAFEPALAAANATAPVGADAAVGAAAPATPKRPRKPKATGAGAAKKPAASTPARTRRRKAAGEG
jgi:hypothetical protein